MDNAFGDLAYVHSYWILTSPSLPVLHSTIFYNRRWMSAVFFGSILLIRLVFQFVPGLPESLCGWLLAIKVQPLLRSWNDWRERSIMIIPWKPYGNSMDKCIGSACRRSVWLYCVSFFSSTPSCLDQFGQFDLNIYFTMVASVKTYPMKYLEVGIENDLIA